jgi:hypothetical protein
VCAFCPRWGNPQIWLLTVNELMRGLDLLLNVLRGQPSSLSGSMYPRADQLADDANSAAARVLRHCADVDAQIDATAGDTSISRNVTKQAARSVQQCAQALEELDVEGTELNELLGASQDTNLFVSNQLTSAGAMCAGLHAHASLRDTDDYAQLRAAQRRLFRMARAKSRQLVMKNCHGIALTDRDSNLLKIRASRLADTVGGAADDDDHVPTGIWILLVVILVLFLLIVALLIALQLAKRSPPIARNA